MGLKEGTKMKYMNETIIRQLLPRRERDTNKGDYGKILLLCGSRGFTGAAALAAMGALRTGAGLCGPVRGLCIWRCRRASTPSRP